MTILMSFRRDNQRARCFAPKMVAGAVKVEKEGGRRGFEEGVSGGWHVAAKRAARPMVVAVACGMAMALCMVMVLVGGGEQREGEGGREMLYERDDYP